VPAKPKTAAPSPAERPGLRLPLVNQPFNGDSRRCRLAFVDKGFLIYEGLIHRQTSRFTPVER